MAKISFSLPSFPGFSFEGTASPETQGAVSTRMSIVNQLTDNTASGLYAERRDMLFAPEVNANDTINKITDKVSDPESVNHVATGAIVATAHQERANQTRYQQALENVGYAHDNPGKV
jgi:hypothetical protein